MSEINIDDTTDCPVATHCESCGSDDGLTVGTLDSSVGVFCATFCQSCAQELSRLPVISPVVVAVRVGRHCEHVGIDLDQAQELHRDRAESGSERGR
jgi:hypothetical protein